MVYKYILLNKRPTTENHKSQISFHRSSTYVLKILSMNYYRYYEKYFNFNSFPKNPELGRKWIEISIAEDILITI